MGWDRYNFSGTRMGMKFLKLWAWDSNHGDGLGIGTNAVPVQLSTSHVKC